MKTVQYGLFAAFILFLAACGGTGGDDRSELLGAGGGVAGGVPTSSCFDDCLAATGDVDGCTGACGGMVGAGGGINGTGGAVGTGGTGGGVIGAGGGMTGTGGGTFGPGGCGPVDTTSMCSQPPAPGSQAPPPLPPYSGGVCPPIVPWDDTRPFNNIAGGRRFIVVEPQNKCEGEVFPVAFMWHWISGEAEDFVGAGALQQVADDNRIVFVVPDAKGATVGLGINLDTQWPFDATQTEQRMQEEFRFFDDMLSCVGQQYNINVNCVGTVGISAGALFTSQLLQDRGHYLSAAVVLSGGVGGVVKPWKGSQHRMPGFVLWGGPADNFGGFFDFNVISADLSRNMAQSGHFVVECVHTCGHVPPLLEPLPDGTPGLQPLLSFFLEHPYWLPDGASPYIQGLPSTFPGFCGVGAGGGIPSAPHTCPGVSF